MKHRLSLCAVLVFAIVLGFGAYGAWRAWVYPKISLRPSNDGDPLYERYFGINGVGTGPFRGTKDQLKLRNIIVGSGTFGNRTRVVVSLFQIKQDEDPIERSRIIQRQSLEVGRTAIPADRNAGLWQHLDFVLALGEFNEGDVRVVCLGYAGQSTTGSDFQVGLAPAGVYEFTDTAACSIDSETDLVIFAEGDQRLDLTPRTTLADFVQTNRGNYLVVTARWKPLDD